MYCCVDPKWDKYKKLIDEAVASYKECNQEDCSCHAG
jgi:hypothetical protein